MKSSTSFKMEDQVIQLDRMCSELRLLLTQMDSVLLNLGLWIIPHIKMSINREWLVLMVLTMKEDVEVEITHQ